ncbi:carbohydrate kinase family protein [Acidipropionibacterium virtanenii]|uniref:Fructokinase n=1 Tax=Acidipropionibacterium virtanenii TaxID=2057246 RepID=A0A344UQ62_9ACTN|nr:carbohydrate kinase [Acidipropionibacterium virtanenii]AXE37410.1 Fructokinase [Acidipropionibacterium virtanenii]
MSSAASQPTALVIGEALIDVVHKGGTVSEHPGGSPMNVAIGLARLGRDVELATWYGDDERGDVIEAHLAADKVGLADIVRNAARTSTATATVTEDGKATYVFDLDWSLPRVDLPADCPVLHTGSLGATIEPGVDVVRSAVIDARPSATITYDPNIRPDLQPDPAAAREVVEGFVRLADVVKASDEDLAYLGEGADAEEVLAGWLDLGPKLLVMTCGGDGVIARTASGLEVHLPAKKVTVADTVGAGDSFMAGLIDGLWSAGLLGADNRDALGRITAPQLEAVLERCALIAGITVSRDGANPPTLAELETA